MCQDFVGTVIGKAVFVGLNGILAFKMLRRVRAGGSASATGSGVLCWRSDRVAAPDGDAPTSPPSHLLVLRALGVRPPPSLSSDFKTYKDPTARHVF